MIMIIQSMNSKESILNEILKILIFLKIFWIFIFLFFTFMFNLILSIL